MLQRLTIPAAASSVPEPEFTVFVIDTDDATWRALDATISHAGWQPRFFEGAEDFLGHEAIDAPSCLVLDAQIPGADGLDLQRRVATRISMPVIFVGGRDDLRLTVRAMKAGAFDFLTKPLDAGRLRKTMAAAFECSLAMLARDRRLRCLRRAYASLSRRECQVMALVVSGLLNKQIAFELGISEITVKVHRGHVMRKMNAGSLADLVRMAASLDLDLDPDLGLDPSGAGASALRIAGKPPANRAGAM